MRTKLLGAFIAALAVVAFAALPASAMGEEVVLKNGETKKKLKAEDELTLFSSNFELAFGSGLKLKCAENEVVASVSSNPGATATVGSSRLEGASEAHFCATDLNPRIEARVQSVTFSGPIEFSAEGGVGYAKAMAKFTIDAYDRSVQPGSPVAECTFKGALTFEYELGKSIEGANKAQISGSVVNLPEESLGECGFTGTIVGDFAIYGKEESPVQLITVKETEAEIELRDKEGKDPGSIVLYSGNFEFGGSSWSVACEEIEITATRRGVGRYTPRSSRFEAGGTMEGPNGDELCPVSGIPGRELRVKPLEFTKDLEFTQHEGNVSLSTEFAFELDFWARSIISNAPFRKCHYKMSVEAEVEGDAVAIGETPILVADRGPITGCSTSGLYFTGDLRMTDRNGEPVEAM